MGDNKITLSLSGRTVHGKKVAKLRAEGLIPVVVYGAEMAPQSAQATIQEIEKVVRAAGTHAPVHITLGDKKRIAMVKEVNFDPAKNRINHVAFHAVKANQPVEAMVPVHLIGEGESEAEKAGLIILQNIDELEVKALPMDLPEALEVDIRALKEAGERVLVGDIKLPANVELVEHTDGRDEEEDDEEERPSIFDLQVASVWEPSALQAQNEATAGSGEDVSEVAADNGAEATTAEVGAKEGEK